MKKFLEELGLDDIYTGDLRNLAIAPVQPNTRFRVEEYDGDECLVMLNEENWEFS